MFFTHYRSSKCLSINNHNMIVVCFNIKSDFKDYMFCGFWPFLCTRMNYYVFFSTDWAVWFPAQLMMQIFSPDRREHGTAVTPWLDLHSLVPAKTRRTKLLSLCLLPMTQMRLKVLPVIVLVAGSWGGKGVVIETPRDENSNFVFHTQI